MVEVRLRTRDVGTHATVMQGNIELVVLEFNRDDAAFDEVLQTSPPAVHALELGADIKPIWANGAKIFVPDIDLGTISDFRVHLLPRHVVLHASDVQEILDALKVL